MCWLAPSHYRGTIIVWVHRFSSLQFIVQLRKCSASRGKKKVGCKKGFLLLNVQCYEYFRRKSLKPFLQLQQFLFREKKGKNFSIHSYIFIQIFEPIKFHCDSLKMVNKWTGEKKSIASKETSKTWNILFHYPVLCFNRKN